MATKSLGARVRSPTRRFLQQVHQHQRHYSRRSHSHGSHAPPRHVCAGRNSSLPSHNFGLRAQHNSFSTSCFCLRLMLPRLSIVLSFSSSLTRVMVSNISILLQKAIEFQTEPLIIDVGMNVLHLLHAMWTIF